jgi:N-acetyl-anhydromuramyl-L-alanine amidase AmpD
MIFSKEPDRLNLDTKGSKSPWMPPGLATIHTPSMPTRGTYRKGWPEGAVIHFTAGRDNPKATIDYGRSQGYAYLCIGGNGHIYQAHDMRKWGYHAGKSYWKGLGEGCSRYLVGIEVCSAGRLDKIAPGKYRSWFGGTYGEDETRYSAAYQNIQKGFYHKYTQDQEEALIKVIKWLYYQAPDIFKIDYVLGHDEVSPGRKDDPGGALSQSMPEFRSYLKQLIVG